MSVIELAEPRTPRPSDIVWLAPTVNNVRGALDAVDCFAERLAALFDSNTDDMQACLLEDVELPEHLRNRAYSIWMIYVLAGEKLGEIQTLLGAITTAASAQPKTSVGHHVDIRRRGEFSERMEAFRAANAVNVPDDADDETFNRIVDPVCAAIQAVISTRAPDLRTFHEKLTFIREQDAWQNQVYGAIDAIFDDVEYLARRYEIDGDSAAQAEVAA